MRHQLAFLLVCVSFAGLVVAACGSDSTKGAAAQTDGGATDDGASDAAAPHAQILAINDFHGALEAVNGIGGAAYLAAQVKALRTPGSIFVSAGDLVGASPLISGYDHDEGSIEAMNAMGLAYNGVGNHEFDEGTAELLRLQNGGCHPVDGCKGGGTFAGAKFKFLAANVIVTATKKTLFPPYAIESFGDVKVAFVGVTLKDTPATTLGSLIGDVEFQDEATTVKALVPELAAQGVNSIVLLIHQGGAQSGAAPSANGCVSLSGPIGAIAKAMPPEVKVILSGHTHQLYNCVIGGKLVTSAGANGAYVTNVDLTLDETSHGIAQATATNVEITTKLTPDPDVGAIVSKWHDVVSKIGDTVVGQITSDLTAVPDSMEGESAMGDVIADSFLAATSSAQTGGAQIAFMNGGGVRSYLAYAKTAPETTDGQVRYAELYTVEPFGNQLYTIDVSGAGILSILESTYGMGGGAPHVAGLTGSFTAATAPHFAAADLVVGGQPLSPTTTYRVTVNAYLVQDTSGFTPFAAGAKLSTATIATGTDLDATVSYFKASSPISPPSPRFASK